MKYRTYFLNTVLAVLTASALIVAVLVRTFAPWIILPQLSIPALVLISLVALVIDHYFAPGAKRCYVCIPVLSVITFGLLPYAAGFILPVGIVIYGLSGGAVFTVVTWMYTAMIDRLSSGPIVKFAAPVSAVILYIASQCLHRIIL